MAYKVVDADQLDADLTTVADAIREKTGGTELLSFPDGMAAEIAKLSDGSNEEYVSEVEEINKQLSGTIGTVDVTLQENADRLDELNAELEQTLYGTDTGGKSHYDLFWDAYQDYGNRESYSHAFRGTGWTDATFEPKYDIVCGEWDNYLFTNSRITDIKGILESQGVTLDTANVTALTYFFQNCITVSIPPLDLRSCTSVLGVFQNCNMLQAIELNNVREELVGNNAFSECVALTTVKITGTIGTSMFDLHWSPLLTYESILSIINALSDTTSDQTVTFSLTAVNNAFETATGAADGSTSDEWLGLVETKSNWTISLA